MPFSNSRPQTPAATILTVVVIGLLVQASALSFDSHEINHAQSGFRVSATPTTGSVTNPNPYSTVSATPAGKSGVSSTEAKSSRKYLIASFPNMKQVAYCHLPDNVWRPLVVGDVSYPQGLAVDTPNSRLYVADPVEGKIFWYSLEINADGNLVTGAHQYVAVEQYSANWMAINGLGDLYFTGHAVVSPPQSAYDAVFRQDASKIAMGNTLSPMEIYSRSNTGMPNSKVWMPSGLAVDSFNVYWANQELGSTHGTVNKGVRQNTGAVSDMQVKSLSTAQEEVRGMMSTGTTLYYVTTGGVYGVSKTQPTTITEPNDGLVAGPPQADSNAPVFDPKSISWDGDGTAYFTDYTGGFIFSIPAMDLNQHNLTKFVDAPGAFGIVVANFESSSAHAVSSFLWLGLTFFACSRNA